MTKRIVVLAPHLDDETFNCGGTIVNEIKDGSDVSVIYMTDSRKSHLIDLGISEDPTPDEVAAERREEVFAATAELGIPPANLTFLDFPDGELIDHVVSAKERIIRFLSDNWPDEVYIPARRDKHTDHVATNEIAVTAVKAINRPITIMEYVTWVRREIAGVRRDVQGKVGGESADNAEEVSHDISDSLPAKIAAINRYASQITLHWPSQVRPVLDEDFLKPFRGRAVETFRRYRLC